MSQQIPFDQRHPDAQQSCGYWLDLTEQRCGQCDRCKREILPVRVAMALVPGERCDDPDCEYC